MTGTLLFYTAFLTALLINQLPCKIKLLASSLITTRNRPDIRIFHRHAVNATEADVRLCRALALRREEKDLLLRHDRLHVLRGQLKQRESLN